MRYIAAVVLLTAWTLPQSGCTLADRQDIKSDAGAYVGAPEHPDGSIDKNEAGEPVFDGAPDYDPNEVIAAAGAKAAEKAAQGDWAGLAIYVLGGAVVIGVGYAKRKLLGQVARKVTRR